MRQRSYQHGSVDIDDVTASVEVSGGQWRSMAVVEDPAQEALLKDIPESWILESLFISVLEYSLTILIRWIQVACTTI